MHEKTGKHNTVLCGPLPSQVFKFQLCRIKERENNYHYCMLGGNNPL